MHRIILVLITLLIASPAAPDPGPAAPERLTGSLQPQVTLLGGDAAEREMAQSAVDRFLETGLPLPDLEIHLHADWDGCGGVQGKYKVLPRTGRIDLCLTVERIMLHELGHAWASVTLAIEDKQAFIDHVGTDNWNDRSTPWHRRGTEIAADAISHALLSAPLEHDHSITRFLGQFEFLTGLETPRELLEAPVTQDVADERDAAGMAAYAAWRAAD